MIRKIWVAMIASVLSCLSSAIAHEGEELAGTEQHTFLQRIGGAPTIVLVIALALGIVALVYWFLNSYKRKTTK